MRMKCFAVAVLLGLLSLGRSAPLSSCESLLKPIQVTTDQVLGRWLYLGSSSNVPGSRSVAHLMTSVWLDGTAVPQSNILTFIQNQKIYGQCSSLTYNVTFENSAMIIEQPFYLKDIFLVTDCPDCLVVNEEVISGKDTFNSLLLFSRSRSVSPPVLEMFKRQAECLKMPSPIMLDPNSAEGICLLLQMVGKWMYIAETTGYPLSELLGEALIRSIWMNVMAGSQNNTLNIYQAQNM
ncbi:uncharacterized protein LOC115361886 [Myripristis murdjan]|uniref:uncharacterized protein LOC115361886 n=1 Tax=Myripristis murdjan TaxID=586833 RepID=UPI001175E8FB|nr:uncharacterized protein LOC115361886 [Myripristis murdjan]